MAINFSVRWADNTKEFVRNMKEGLDQIEVNTAAVDKLANSLIGTNVIKSANNWAAALQKVGGEAGALGGVLKLSNAEVERAIGVFDRAIAKADAMGQSGLGLVKSYQEISDVLHKIQPDLEKSTKGFDALARGMTEAGKVNIDSARLVAGLTASGKAAEVAAQGMVDAGKAAAAAQKPIDDLARSLGGQTTIKAANDMTAALKQIGGVQTLTASETKQANAVLDQAIAKYHALGTTVPAELAQVSTALKKASSEHDALANAQKGVFESSSALTSVFGQLTAAFSVSSLINTAVGALVNFTKEAFASADALVNLSVKTGLSTKTIQEMQFVAKQSGTDMNAMADAAFKMGVNIEEGTAKARHGAEALGLSWKELRAASPDEQWNMVVDAAERMEDPQKRNAALVELFGKTAKEILPAIADGYRKVASEANAAGDAQVHAVDRAGDAIDRFKTKTINSFTQTIGTFLLYREAMNALTDEEKNFIIENDKSVTSVDKARDAFIEAAAAKQKYGNIPGAFGGGGTDIRLPSEAAQAVPDSFVASLKAAEAGFRALTGAQRDEIFAALTLNKSNDDIINNLNITEGVLNRAKKAFEDNKSAAARAAEEQKKYAESVARYNSTEGPSYLSILGKIGNELYEGIAFDKARGKSTEDLSRIYNTTSTVIDQVVKSEADYAKAAEISNKVRAVESTGLTANINEWEKLGTTVKGQQAAFDSFGKLYERLQDDIKKSTMTTADYQVAKIEEWRDKELAALNRSIDGWQIHEQRIKETAQKEIADVQYAQESIVAMLARIQAEQDRAPIGNKFAESFVQSLTDIPSVLQRALEGGGGFEAAGQALGVKFADDFLKAYEARIKAQGGLSKVATAALSIGATGGAAIGGAVGGAGGATVGGLAASVGGSALAAGGMTAATVGGAIALGAATAGIGAAAVGVYLLAKHFLTVSQNEKDARIEFQKLQSLYGSLPATIDAVGKAYEATGHTAEEAQAALKRALDATHKSAAEEQEALKPIAAILAEAEEKGKKVSTAFDALVGAGRAFGGTVPDAFKDAVRQLADMKGITDEEKAALLAMTKDVKPNFEQLTATAAKYGVTLEGLGKSFQQANIEGRAKQISGDFDALTKAGGDAGGILSGMSDEISQLVNDSKKFGTAIPENMRVLISELVRSGQLLDENGNKIEDMSGISFEDTPIDESIASLTDAIKELIAALTGVPVEIDKINKKPIKIPISVETDPNAPQIFPTQGFLAGDQVSIPSFATGSGGFQDFGVGTIAMLHGHEAVVTAAQASTVTNSTSSQSTTVVVPVVIPVGASQSDVVDRVMAALPENVRRNSKGLRSAMLGGMGLPVTTWTQSR